MAISYFVYAQYVMDGDFQLTRAGVVIKDNSYSSHISSKERSDCYNNALTAANGFLNEVKDFIRDKFPQYYSTKKQTRINSDKFHCNTKNRRIICSQEKNS